MNLHTHRGAIILLVVGLVSLGLAAGELFGKDTVTGMTTFWTAVLGVLLTLQGVLFLVRERKASNS